MFPKKVTDNRKKNVKRMTSFELYEECLKRDKWCVICSKSFDLDYPHHVLFWLEKEYWPRRNDIDRLVTICRDCHYDIHSKWHEDKREICKEYLKTIYDTPSS